MEIGDSLEENKEEVQTIDLSAEILEADELKKKQPPAQQGTVQYVIDNLLDLTEKDTVKINIRNLATILRNDPALKNSLAYNEFTYDIELTQSIKVGAVHFEKGKIDDSFTKAVILYIAENYYVDFKKHILQDTLETVSRERSYNPLKDYLNNCYQNYNGKSDPLTIISDYLGVEETEYTRLVTDIFFRGAIAKVFNPQKKFDFVLDLVGDQGTGKTDFLTRLFNPYYTDGFYTFHEKDDFALMVKSWLANDDEMTASKKSLFEKTKKFITQIEIEFRPPYAAKTIKVTKNFVIARTTNNLQHLRDSTGDRRFLPILVKRSINYKKKFAELTTEALEQFWGGVVARYKENPSFDLTSEQLELIESNRDNFKGSNEVTETLDEYTAILLPKDFHSWEQWDRQDYIQQILIRGVAYKDREKTKQIKGTEKRDRINIKDVKQEAFPDIKDRKLDNAIRLYYSSHGWVYRKNIKFGERVTSGYMR